MIYDFTEKLLLNRIPPLDDTSLAAVMHVSNPAKAILDNKRPTITTFNINISSY